MPLKDLLVVADSDPATEQRIEIAANLAEREGAHLTGLYIESSVKSGRFDRFNAPLFTTASAERPGHAAAVQQIFDTVAARRGITGEWRVVSGDPSRAAALHGRYADLIILGQLDPEVGSSANDRPRPEDVALTSGQPILIVPYTGHFGTVGRRVLVGWDTSREATRAIRDALPLLRAAQSVTILSIDPQQAHEAHGAVPGADMAHHLARHGIDAVAEWAVSNGIDAGNVLLSRAADLSADLLVIGAYGHPRFRELVLGGVTRTILESMTLPVLMSH
jgi:nucleotide-binding universal stress UspA family protein